MIVLKSSCLTIMADDLQNTTIITDLDSQEDDRNPLNINEIVGSLQFDDIERDEHVELVGVQPKDDHYNSNVIILGSIKPSDPQICNVNQKPKRRKSNKLEVLGVTEIKEEFDTFTDETDKIYRTYKLRNVKKPDYRIPSIHDLPKPEYVKVIKPEIHRCSEPECAKVFSTIKQHRAHMRREHIQYKCSLCSQMFETNAKLISHKSIHEAENRSYICHGCKLAFSDHCDFLIHEFTHSNTYRNKFVCPECGLISSFRSSIQNHVQTHFNRTITCPICSVELPGAHRLQEHIRQHNSSTECVECGKLLRNKRHYNDHMSTHTGVKIHQCLYCGKGFSTKLQKVIHTRIHTNERIFSCKVCDRKFLQYTDWHRHESTHDQERKLQCDKCEKKFKKKCDLYSHVKTHRKEYGCSECDKKFSFMISLKNHLLQVHSTERPVECKICDKKYASQQHYKKHTKSKMHKRSLFKITK